MSRVLPSRPPRCPPYPFYRSASVSRPLRQIASLERLALQSSIILRMTPGDCGPQPWTDKNSSILYPHASLTLPYLFPSPLRAHCSAETCMMRVSRSPRRPRRSRIFKKGIQVHHRLEGHHCLLARHRPKSTRRLGKTTRGRHTSLLARGRT